jgi:hypothetical protein
VPLSLIYIINMPLYCHLYFDKCHASRSPLPVELLLQATIFICAPLIAYLQMVFVQTASEAIEAHAPCESDETPSRLDLEQYQTHYCGLVQAVEQSIEARRATLNKDVNFIISAINFTRWSRGR